MKTKSRKSKVIVVTPVYNDWLSFQCLVEDLNQFSNSLDIEIKSIVAINDGSIDQFNKEAFISKTPICIVNLSNNLGHQRAIAIGLSYVEENYKDLDYIIVMDSDGEDKPTDILKLIKTVRIQTDESIIFAKRKKRSEGVKFKLFYSLYKLLFYKLTSYKLEFGNYSCIPKSLLTRVVAIPELWNHYSCAIMKSKITYTSVDTNRGVRYQGKSKMNFQNLILHGLSSISIYLDIVSIRLLFVAFFAICLTLLSILIVVGLTVFTSLTIPGWPSIVALILLNILAIFVLTTFLILLFQLNQKSVIKFPPRQFYKDFILSVLKF